MKENKMWGIIQNTIFKEIIQYYLYKRLKVIEVSKFGQEGII